MHSTRPPHFTNNPHRQHRFDHHSDEFQISDKKIDYQLGDDIDIIGTQEGKEEIDMESTDKKIRRVDKLLL